MSSDSYHLNLDALIEEDLSGYEYYVSLSPEIKRKLDTAGYSHAVRVTGGSGAIPQTVR